MSRLTLATLLVALAALAACSKETTAPGVYSLSGRVRLVGFLVHSDGRFAGTRVVEDADGVRIDLMYGTRVVGTTLTTDGAYRFTGLSPGGYVARAQVFDRFVANTGVLTIPNHDVVALDTLRLTSFGSLLPTPNPLDPVTLIHFEIADSAQVDVKVLDMAGATVRTLFSRYYEPGSFSLPWDGYDEHGAPAPAGLYWVTYAQGDDIRAHLLFK